MLGKRLAGRVHRGRQWKVHSSKGRQGKIHLLACLAVLSPLFLGMAEADEGKTFRRIASFPVFLNTDVASETVAEIVAASEDGKLLVYSDGATEKVGFVDISDPYHPVAAGVVDLAGEPTSVAVKGDFALVAVNTSQDFVNPSGLLQVVDIHSRDIVAEFELRGQPDSIAVSPDGRYAAIAIENERDEDLGDGRPPQAPAGFLGVLDIKKKSPNRWSMKEVPLMGLADKFPDDPEPEFISINHRNQAVVTLQENNHIVIVDLRRCQVVADFSAGTVNLNGVDTIENELIEQNGILQAVPREPDGVVWTSAFTFGTADEGDLDGGSRGFTTFLSWGPTLFKAGTSVEDVATRLGHYPEERSENKGNEPEGIAYASYRNYWWFYDNLLFVGSERSSIVLVYKMPGLLGQLLGKSPQLQQVLPCGVGPEGLLPIPQRDLFVVAAEADERGAAIRSSISIYKRLKEPEIYPQIKSADLPNGKPIPWGALSGLSSDPMDADRLFTIHDSFYRQSRIYSMDVTQQPAVIDSEVVIRDSQGTLLQALTGLKADFPLTPAFDPAALINDDLSVNLDPEGIVTRRQGGFWIASEGAGNLSEGISDPQNRPFQSPNMLIRVDGSGVIQQVALPPVALTSNQLRFGFEGVTAREENGKEVLYVAFQREWTGAGDPGGLVRIGRFDPDSADWSFAYYPIEAATSPNGGWVGNSEITHLGGDEFLMLERDNQAGPDAVIKRVYRFSIAGITFQPAANAPSFDLVSKSLVRDLIADGDYQATGGLVLEKLEGMAVVNGEILVVNDNDGVDDSNGETQLFRFPRHQ